MYFSLFFAQYMPYYSIAEYLIIVIIYIEKYKLRNPSLRSFRHVACYSSILGQNIAFCTEFSNTSSLHSSVTLSQSERRKVVGSC
jgi:hypothetical protein